VAGRQDSDQLIDEMNAALAIPGLSNLWVNRSAPHRHALHRHQEPVGIKIAGPDLKVIEKIGEQV